MKSTTNGILIPFPLPNKIVADSGKEIKQKVKSLAKTHGAVFSVSLSDDIDGKKVSQIFKY